MALVGEIQRRKTQELENTAQSRTQVTGERSREISWNRPRDEDLEGRELSGAAQRCPAGFVGPFGPASATNTAAYVSNSKNCRTTYNHWRTDDIRYLINI